MQENSMNSEVRKNLRYYNDNAQAWANRSTDPFHRQKEFLKFIRYFKKGDRIVDIGCASGIHVPMFLGMGGFLKYEGFDLSGNLISIAKKRYLQLMFYTADIMAAKSLPKNKYKGFWASAVLMHIPERDWPIMLRNIAGMCKHGAVGFIILPKHRPSPASRKDYRFFTYWDKEKLKKYLDRVNWKILASSRLYSFNQGDWSWYIVKLP